MDTEYIKIGREATYELVELLKPDPWIFEKSYSQYDLYLRNDTLNMVVFKIETKFPYPCMLVFDYFRNLEKRMMWDGQNYDSLK